MRRTLLAVGIAVLVSMLLAPHSSYWEQDFWGNTWGSYWWDHFPLFYRTERIKWPAFFAQTAFVALLAAIVVNLRKSWRRKPKRTA